MASSRVAKTKLSSSLGPSTRHGHGKVLVEEAMKMARQDGAVLLDVRLEKDFEQVHAEGAVNVPLFRPIEGGAYLPTPSFMEGKKSRIDYRGPELVGYVTF
eukprot:jgi/Pico_ML_1/54890/g744.t2